MLGYFLWTFSKLTVFLELRPRKTVRFSEQILSADKIASIFPRQMESIVYIANAPSRNVKMVPVMRRRLEEVTHGILIYFAHVQNYFKLTKTEK